MEGSIQNLRSDNNFDKSANLEIVRKELVKKYNLPENTTLEEIDAYAAEEYRKNLAIKKGLPQNATWAEIDAKS